MEDRETYEVKTPIKGIKVVLKSWITGKESQSIDSAMFAGVGTSVDGKKLSPKLSDTMIADQENASIKAVVVSVDGNEQNVVDAVLGMRAGDYKFVLNEVDKVVNGDIDEKKANASETNTTKS
jgi:hypothetical protein